MALLGWIISFGTLFAGLALRQDMPAGGSTAIANGLFMAAFLACPTIWQPKPLGISRGQRVVAVVALILCLPMVMLPA
ncbi:hypothetical protein WG908_03965 [Sphingobium sp. AN641]|uniref:hypothetical protein n=1 Tax=Sphingobium sp. AN641 TaxID=3133443 RepID=UPI0030BFDBB8